MSENKLSRRDAMKLLGAAVGAAALSTLPSKWNTPELAAGVLPAHARQSGAIIVGTHTFAAATHAGNGTHPNASAGSFPAITPNDPDISRSFSISTTGSLTITSALTGFIVPPTDPPSILIDYTGAVAGDTIVVTWTFTNASDGSGTFVDTITIT
jgi:hypothetical protein